MPDLLRIQPAKGRKGRTFEVSLFNYVTANNAWDVGTSDYDRPVFLSYGGSEQEVRAFTANLRTGRRILVMNGYSHEEGKVECIKSAGYRVAQQRLQGDVMAVSVYLPHLFELDPGLSPERVRFLFAPPAWWVDEQLQHLGDLPEEERREAAVASYFAAYIDRRTSLPILNETGFHLRLWRSAQKRPWALKPGGVRWKQGALFVYPEVLIGIECVTLIDASHEQVEEWLYEQTRRYFEEERPRHLLEEPHQAEGAADAPPAAVAEEESPRAEIKGEESGKVRVSGRRRVLPNAQEIAGQLSLFGDF